MADEADLARELEGLLARDDGLFARLVAEGGTPPLRRRPGGVEGLCRIVVSQQVSTASAAAIWARFEAGFGRLEAERLAGAEDSAFAACGLSKPKARTMRAIGAAVVSGALALDALHGLDAEAAHGALRSVKGVGPWTADVYLMFCHGHPDVWPVGDVALQEAVRQAKRLRKRPDPERLEKIARPWRPHRAVAARVLWAWYDSRRVAVRAAAQAAKSSGR
ncbi:MAG: DNA-3-methyladenine glycosylase 2 family protein [Hyphomicrobiales bacterium]|nr:DNA-3-methyladenine glycosylase 2 family protein [Hyphomicrobiales bacterium]MDE2016195.1 DNA-3-methyladenine glycosylase 2 family protein [Hyphomicrobiales bacterium]